MEKTLSLDFLGYLIPEAILIGMALLLLIFSLIPFFKAKNQIVFFYLSLLGAFLNLLAQYIFWQQKGPALTWPFFSANNHLFFSKDILFYKFILSLFFLLQHLIVYYYFSAHQEFVCKKNKVNNKKSGFIEFLFFCLLITACAQLLFHARNLVLFLLCFEMISLFSYILVAWQKTNSLSAEAGYKYALYGALSSGMMLYGLSHCFGIAGGTMDLYAIMTQLAVLLSQDSKNYFLVANIVLFFMGPFFKLGLFPLHQWAFDVYQGTSLPAMSFLSLIPKFALLFIFYSLANSLMGINIGSIEAILIILGVISLLWGHLGALNQGTYRRFLAYSSLGNLGTILLVFPLGTVAADAITFYSVFYFFSIFIILFICSLLENHYRSDSFDMLSGFAKRYGLLSFALLLAMASLIGIAPLVGFMAKVKVLMLLLDFNTMGMGLFIFVLFSSVMAASYYLALIKKIYVFDPLAHDKIAQISFLNQFIVVILLIPLIFFGLRPDLFFNFFQ